MLELADILRVAWPAFRQAHATRLSRRQRTAVRDIVDCRTAVLGGHLQACDHCPARRYTYHSCRNRHCPKCQGPETRRWLETQHHRLLPVPYFLVTFTLPSELRRLARDHPRRVYGILMTAAAQALARLTADPRYLGASPGMIAVLHTWTRALLFHPHVHFLVTAGGFDAQHQRWRRPRHPRFLVPGYALSILFRAKVRDALRRAGLLARTDGSVWARTRPWVVHLRHAGSGQRVLAYLARYVFRVALYNSRLEHFDGATVTFRYRDNRSGRLQHCRLAVDEFLRRFLQHVLPRGFTKVRSYGIYSPSRRHDLARARTTLPPPRESPVRLESPANGTRDLPEETPPQRCPDCRIGRLYLVETVARARAREPP